MKGLPLVGSVVVGSMLSLIAAGCGERTAFNPELRANSLEGRAMGENEPETPPDRVSTPPTQKNVSHRAATEELGESRNKEEEKTGQTGQTGQDEPVALLPPSNPPPEPPAPSTPGPETAAPSLWIKADDSVSVTAGRSRQILPSLAEKIGDELVPSNLIESPRYTFTLGAVTGLPSGSTASVDASGLFVAPSEISGSEASVEIRVGVASHPEVHEKLVVVRILPQDGFGTIDDHLTQASVGNVYRLPSGTTTLPDFSTMTPVQQVMLPNFAVTNHDWLSGFPGVADLVEWFGIRFTGRVRIAETGLYTFMLCSDDGSKLSLRQNGVWNLVVDNDGQHSSRERTGSVTLEAGTYDFLLDYFQGPRMRIGLELFWSTPTNGDLHIVPAEHILRPLP